MTFANVLLCDDSFWLICRFYNVQNKEHLNFETTYLPLLGKDGTIQHIWGASDCSYNLQPDELLAIKVT